MHLVNWAEVVTLCRDVKADTLVTPFMKGEVAAPGAYHDTFPGSLMHPHVCQPGYILLKHVEKVLYVWNV